jgi:hypothetical protein
MYAFEFPEVQVQIVKTRKPYPAEVGNTPGLPNRNIKYISGSATRPPPRRKLVALRRVASSSCCFASLCNAQVAAA